MRKKNTQSKRDKYLLKKFGIDELTYNSQLSKQDGLCAICGRPPGTIALSVDHDHKIEKHKVIAKKVGKTVWRAFPENGNGELDFEYYGASRQEVVQKVKDRLLRTSLRAVLCHSCNRGLQIYRDNPILLHNAAVYLERYYNHISQKQDLYYFG